MAEVWDILVKLWLVLCQMAPYLLLGFAVAGVLSEVISARHIERHLGAGKLGAVVKASLLGVPLPLCSCGVIPVAASLRRHGASAGATTSFLISTPQTGVDSILVTYSLMGGVFAVFRPVVAFISGVIGGALVNVFGKAPMQWKPQAADSDDAAAAKKGNRLFRMIRYGFVALPGDIGRSLLLGLVVAALITAILPESMLAGILGKGIGAMVVMLVVGVPFYVCATASVPIAAALIATENISAGAALVFLMTGPATNGATIATVWKVLGRRSALIYLGSVMGTALAAGLALDGLFAMGDFAPPVGHIHEMAPALWQTASAVILLALLAPPLLRPLLRGRLWSDEVRETMEHMESIALTIDGITCSHCAAAVERALGECEGVESVGVDVAAGRAIVAGEGLDGGALAATVTALGYAAEIDSADRGDGGESRPDCCKH